MNYIVVGFAKVSSLNLIQSITVKSKGVSILAVVSRGS
jgi:hypothetical protein